MKLSYRWLGEMVDLSDAPPAELARRLTFHVTEIEDSQTVGGDLEAVLTARVAAVRPHPNADKLRLCTVDTGGGREAVEVVCGAPNVAKGQVVCYAPEGVTLPGGPDGPIHLERREIRGVESRGMICSERELGFGDDHDGIVVLPSQTPVGEPLPHALGLDDTIFEIANVCITHRPDLWGHAGFARELGALLRKEVAYPQGLAGEALAADGDPFPIAIEDEEGCRRYVGVLIEGLTNGPAPLALRRRIETLGVRSISLLVDLTNLVLLEQGQPLHAFDLRDVRGGEVRVRTAREGETMKTLDGVERRLHPEDLVIADGEGPVAIAGVMGGESSEVRADTTAILLESANFDAMRIRRTAARLNLRTEASTRFEKGLDPELALAAALRFAALAVEHCPGARVSRVVTDVYPRPYPTIDADLSYAHVRRRLGLKIPDMRIRSHLNALGFETRETATGVGVRVPSWRATGDIERPEDLIEEVGRLQGYEGIAPIAPIGVLAPRRPRPERTLERRIGALLSLDLGYTEVKHRSFYGARIATNLGIESCEHLMVRNPTSEEHDRMVLTTAGNLLASVQRNQAAWHWGRLWESARIFRARPAGLPEEHAVFGLATWDDEDRDDPAGAQYLRTIGDVRRVCERLGIGQVRVSEGGSTSLADGFPPADWLHPGRRALLSVGDRPLAIVGEILPSVVRAFGLTGRVVTAEIRAETLLAHGTSTGVSYAPVQRYPVVPFDVAVVVPRRTPAGDVERVIADAVPGSIRDLHVFDVYEGDSIAAGRRSLALRCELFDATRTLSTADADALRARILDALESAGWSVRKD